MAAKPKHRGESKKTLVDSGPAPGLPSRAKTKLRTSGAPPPVPSSTHRSSPTSQPAVPRAPKVPPAKTQRSAPKISAPKISAPKISAPKIGIGIPAPKIQPGVSKSPAPKIRPPRVQTSNTLKPTLQIPPPKVQAPERHKPSHGPPSPLAAVTAATVVGGPKARTPAAPRNNGFKPTPITRQTPAPAATTGNTVVAPLPKAPPSATRGDTVVAPLPKAPPASSALADATRHRGPTSNAHPNGRSATATGSVATSLAPPEEALGTNPPARETNANADNVVPLWQQPKWVAVGVLLSFVFAIVLSMLVGNDDENAAPDEMPFATQAFAKLEFLTEHGVPQALAPSSIAQLGQNPPTQADRNEPGTAAVGEDPIEIEATPEPDQPRPPSKRRRRRKAAAPTVPDIDAAEPEPEPEPKPSVAKQANPKPPPTASELLQRAKAALKKGRPSSAYQLAKRSQAMQRSNGALSVMGKAACRQANKSAALSAVRQLPLLERSAVRRDCRKSGNRIGL